MVVIVLDNKNIINEKILNSKNLIGDSSVFSFFSFDKKDLDVKNLVECSSGIMHDFNNQLMIISGNCELLLLGELSEKQVGYINNILNCVKITKETINETFYSSKNEEKNNEFNFKKMVVSLSEMSKFTSDKEVKILINEEIEDYLYCGKESLIENAILNVIKNGIESVSNEVAEIIINIKKGVFDFKDGSVFGKTSSSEYLMIEIIDNGVGMNSEVIDKIFNPFFSTKEEKGLGIGLSNVLKAVEAHDGYINVLSKLGIGTKIKLFFKIK